MLAYGIFFRKVTQMTIFENVLMRLCLCLLISSYVHCQTKKIPPPSSSSSSSSNISLEELNQAVLDIFKNPKLLTIIDEFEDELKDKSTDHGLSMRYQALNYLKKVFPHPVERSRIVNLLMCNMSIATRALEPLHWGSFADTWGRVALTPDGSRLVAYSFCVGVNDNVIIRVGGCDFHRFPGFINKGDAPIITPDGSKIVVLSEDRCKVCIYDIMSYEFLRDFGGGDGFIYMLDITKDGSKVITGSNKDCAFRVWDIDSGECLLGGDSKSETARIHFLKMTPDGSKAITYSKDGICIYDINENKCIRVLEGSQNFTSKILKVTQDSAKVIAESINGGKVRVWDINSEGFTDLIDGFHLVGLTSEDTVVVSSDKCSYFFDVYKKKVLFKTHYHIPWIGSVAQKGSKFIVGDASTDKCELDIVDIDSEKYSHVCTHLPGHSLINIAITHDGSKFITAVPTADACIWDANLGELLYVFPDLAADSVRIMTHDGSKIILGLIDNDFIFDISLFDLSFKQLALVITLQNKLDWNKKISLDNDLMKVYFSLSEAARRKFKDALES